MYVVLCVIIVMLCYVMLFSLGWEYLIHVILREIGFILSI